MDNSHKALGIFLDHWMKEENKAKRFQHYFKKIRPNIQSVLIVRKMILNFNHLLQDYHRFRRLDLVLRIHTAGNQLVFTHATCGVCPKCQKSVMKFEFYHMNQLMVICQNERCAHVSFFLEDMFWDED